MTHENPQDKPSDEFQIALPWGTVRSRTKDVMQMLPMLALIALIGGAGWLLYGLAQEYIAMQRASIADILAATKAEHAAMAQAMSELSKGMSVLAEEQALGNYIQSLPLERRPNLMVPRALGRRIVPPSENNQ